MRLLSPVHMNNKAAFICVHYVNLSEFTQINNTLFVHVYKVINLTFGRLGCLEGVTLGPGSAGQARSDDLVGLGQSLDPFHIQVESVHTRWRQPVQKNGAKIYIYLV